MKAVENGGTAVGIRCKDGVVLAVEKITTSKLLKPGANKKIATADRHVGIVCYGFPASCRVRCECPMLIMARCPGVCWVDSGRSTLCLPSQRRGVFLAKHIQGAYSDFGPRESLGQLCPGFHSLLERTTLWCDRNCRRLGLGS